MKLKLVQPLREPFKDEVRDLGCEFGLPPDLVNRTMGVIGDGRTYDQACALRAVTSTDGMTADYYPFDHAFLGRVANRIINEVRGSTG